MLLSTVYKIYRQNNPIMETADDGKKDEQYPLLKVTTDSAEIRKNQPDFTVTSPQRGIRQRWPETLSTCCMTFLLLSICLMAIYTLGITLTHRQSVMLQYFRDHEVRVVSNSAFVPKSEVYFIQIIDHGLQTPIMKQGQYFKYMALSYPNLRFNVMYLIDDSKTMFYWPRRTMLRGKCSPYPYKINEKIEKYIDEFEKEHPNVNISITSMSKYLNNSIHKLRIPNCLLTLYARMYTIWQYGGISMDFATYHGKFLKNEDIGYEVKSILDKFNNGLDESAKDVDMNFDIMENDIDFFSTISTFLNMSRLNLNNLFKSSTTIDDVDSNKTTTINTSDNDSTTITPENITEKVINGLQNSTELLKTEPVNGINETKSDDKIKSGKPFLYLVFDLISWPTVDHDHNNFNKQMRRVDLSKKIYIDMDAKFIATYSKWHPLLTYLKSFSGHELHKRSLQMEIFIFCDKYFDSCDIIKNI